jgi:putative transposase
MFIDKLFNQVTLDYSRPGKPTDNPYVESFNGSFRDECLNVNWFMTLDDAQEKISIWQEDYNHFRTHSSIGGLTPNEFVKAYRNNDLQQPENPILA